MKKTHFPPITKTSGILALHWSKRLHHQGKKSGEDIRNDQTRSDQWGRRVMIKKVSNVARGRKG